MLPIGLELPGEPSVPEMMAIARQAEQLGYESFWLTETRFTRDAVTTASAIATVTHSARIASAVINPFTRGAVLIAVTAASLDEVCGGRFVLGIGPGSPTVLARQGISFDQPLVRLRETVEVVRRLLRGEEITFTGKTIQVSRAQLDFAPIRSTIPIYLGVTGPKALALAGEIADGVILNGLVSLAYTKRAVEIVRSGARAVGRNPDDVEITGSIVVSVDADRKTALDAARPLVTLYLTEFPNVARESGFPADVIDRIAAVHQRGESEPLPSSSLTQWLQTSRAPERSLRYKMVSHNVGVPVSSCQLSVSRRPAWPPGSGNYLNNSVTGPPFAVPIPGWHLAYYTAPRTPTSSRCKSRSAGSS